MRARSLSLYIFAARCTPIEFNSAKMVSLRVNSHTQWYIYIFFFGFVNYHFDTQNAVFSVYLASCSSSWSFVPSKSRRRKRKNTPCSTFQIHAIHNSRLNCFSQFFNCHPLHLCAKSFSFILSTANKKKEHFFLAFMFCFRESFFLFIRLDLLAFFFCFKLSSL